MKKLRHCHHAMPINGLLQDLKMYDRQKIESCVRIRYRNGSRTAVNVVSNLDPDLDFTRAPVAPSCLL